MTTIKNKLKDLQNMRLPINSGTLALFISIMAIGFVATATNTPCLSAQSTCAVGGDNEFSGNISLKGNTSHSALLKVDPLLAGDIELTLPDQTGTLALETAALAGLKVMATDVSGEPTTTTVYPLSLTIDSPLKTDGSGNLTATDLDPETDLTIGTGLANQVLGVNSGATALTFTSITGVPTLTADKFVITDGTGALTTTNLLPLSFGANKPIVSDAAGNLTDVTLTADTPMKTDANGNTSASDLDITTDISTSGGTALQEIRVNAGATALEYFTPSGGSDVTKIASGNVIKNSAFGNLPQTGANICWFTQAGTLDDDKTYKLVVNFKLNENEPITTSSQYAKRAYINTLWNQSWATDCGDLTNNNNGVNQAFWSMTQNMNYSYPPNNGSFSNGYAENSGNQYEDCCIPLLPYAYNGNYPSTLGSHIGLNSLVVEFGPAQDSMIGSYKVGTTAQYKSNGLIMNTSTNPTYDNVAGWQVMGSWVSPGSTQTSGTPSASQEHKFEDFQGFKMGCSVNLCFGGDTTWALYEYNK
tara:strand:- start:2224 stop:3816 length:1593 start_codon:yes stop_codon:yes gene_type:complete